VRWMMEAAAAHSAALGWPAERYEKLGKIWVVRRTEIEYLWPVSAGETVTVATWPDTMAAASSVRRYEMHNEAGKPVARGSNQWAWVDARRGRPLRVDAEVREAFDPAKFR
jgi:acyl-CoA thioester hydrolase